MTVNCAYIPPPPLAGFVRLFWLYEGYSLPDVKERVLPTGTVEIVINLQEDALWLFDRQHTDQRQRYCGSLVCGAYSEYFVIDTAQQSSIIGVSFKPGGAFPFLGLPAGELHNTHVSLDALWGTTACDMRDQLLAAETPAMKFHVFEQFLLARVSRPLVRHPAVAFALREFRNMPHTRTIADVTEQIGLSSRRFIQAFNDEVGLTPKLFCRVRRFQEAVRLIGSGQPVNWSEIAWSCGYYDQAHFIHDFRAFSGLNPSAYPLNLGDRSNHVPLCE